jgi:hypothetical protein
MTDNGPSDDDESISDIESRLLDVHRFHPHGEKCWCRSRHRTLPDSFLQDFSSTNHSFERSSWGCQSSDCEDKGKRGPLFSADETHMTGPHARTNNYHRIGQQTFVFIGGGVCPTQDLVEDGLTFVQERP